MSYFSICLPGVVVSSPCCSYRPLYCVIYNYFFSKIVLSWLSLQVAGPYGLPPTPARRALFIFYQTAVPYLAERVRYCVLHFFGRYWVILSFYPINGKCYFVTKIRFAYLSVYSSRIASQGITLDDQFDDSYPFSVASDSSSRVEASMATEIASSSTSRAHPSVLIRFKTKIRECWLYAVQRWPSVCSLPCKLLVT